ncbi:hypothetical protein B0H13DRAFT_1926069 [Mycena leptocephala]|nr:hypothetical protein B0H13DRAFT_1926069 [Mycena leptocephala]
MNLNQPPQTVRQNKNECTGLMEQTYELLNAILMVHINSDTGVELPPSVLTHIGKFTETLHKVHTFVEAQQKGSMLKTFFHRGEMSTLLKDCKAGLQQGLEIFQVPMANHMKDLTQMQEDAERQHQEVLDMIEALNSSPLRESTNKFCIDQQGVFDLSQQASFHSLLNDISSPTQSPCYHQSQRYFMGETQNFQTFFNFSVKEHPGLQFWVQVEWERPVLQELSSIAQKLLRDIISSATQVELAALIGAHIGLKPGKDLTRLVIQYFSSGPGSLLILDNLETLWEPVESRGKVEEFLSLLTGVDHLALLITMRGAERPAKVAWTHPFLPTLKPLEQDAARQTFIDIADNTHDSNEVDKVLSLTDNLPLAISLIAHLVDSDGCSHVLSRWEEEKTSLISEGYDRTSNLDLSFSLSLSSPRLNLHSKDLLSLLSMLPDGLSDVELVQSKFPIDNILGCKAALIRTSLAYSDEHKRLKALVPIREYMQKIQPPGDHLVRPLLTHFQELLEFYIEYQGNQSSSSTVARVSSNYSNIQNVLQNGLEHGHPDLVKSIYCTCYLNSFSRFMGQGPISLLQHIRNVLPYPHDHRLEAYFDMEWLNSRIYSISNPDTLISNALDHFKEFDDPDLKCKFYNSLTTYYQTKADMSSATKFCAAAISLALSTGNTKFHSQGLYSLAWVKWDLGDYSAAQVHANEAQRLAIISADLYREAEALDIEATCCYTLGNYTKAMSLCIRARDLLTLGDVEGVAICDVILADLHLREGNSLAAKTILARCLKVTLEQSQIQTYCLERLGHASCWGDLIGMSSWTAIFLVNSLKRKEKVGIYKALRSLGDIFLAQNDEHTATSLFTVALEGFTEMDVHRNRAECMLQFGDISMGHGDPLKAVDFWERARPLFERSSQAKQVQHINERLAGISEDVLKQCRNNLACLAELNAPAGTIEKLEEDLSDIENLNNINMGNKKEFLVHHSPRNTVLNGITMASDAVVATTADVQAAMVLANAACLHTLGPWLAGFLYAVTPLAPLTAVADNGDKYVGLTKNSAISHNAVTGISSGLSDKCSLQAEALKYFNGALGVGAVVVTQT